MGQKAEILRTIVASPSDVAAERDILETVVKELNRNVARSLGLILELVKWETDSYPGFHEDGGQALIDSALRIEDSDIFIGILWKRFGSPVMSSDSGTEHEFQQAYETWKTSGSPRIMFYFNQKSSTLLNTEEKAQASRVSKFKESISPKGLYWEYEGEDNFKETVREHLTKFLIDYQPKEEIENDPDNGDDLDDDESFENEPQLQYDETVVLEAKDIETYEFDLNTDDILQLDIKCNGSVDIGIINPKDLKGWENDEEIDTHYYLRNRKRANFSFQIERDGPYVVVIQNNSNFYQVEVNVEIYLLQSEDVE
jgi:hypothetical protein